MSYFASDVGELFLYVAYLGIGGAGKSTNVSALHEGTDVASRGRIRSELEANAGFRKDMWSFLHPDRVHGVPVRVHVWWRGGLNFDDNAERYFLRGGLDGAIWVVDSHAARIDANEGYLSRIGDLMMGCGAVTVIQFNKRDAEDAAPIAMLQEVLNPHGLDTFEAIATRGLGVTATMEAVTSQILATM